jgi:hypothetical protein
MPLQTVLAIAGSIALLVGLFGGGVKAKEIEVPRLSVWPRILSSLIGMVLIGIAIRLPNPLQPTESPTLTVVPTTELVSAQQLTIPPPPMSTYSPSDTPTNTPTDTPSPTIEPSPEIIPFGSFGHPGVLNGVFGWQQGNSAINAYEVGSQSNALTLITDGHTDQWADLDTQPVISYPIEGNFETQVKVVFSPSRGHEFAALGVRSAQDHLTWLRLGIGGIPEQLVALDIDEQGHAGKVKTSPYPDNTVYFKIERQGSVFDFSYGPDDVNWIPLQRGYVSEMLGTMEIFLTVGSWGEGGASAQFYDLKILSNK